jgi:glycosyltransferase involved in cell wall biosynthesis
MREAPERLPVTAIVGSHNEAALLRRCLSSVAFCDETIVIDIDSHDDTADVAVAHGARVIRHAWVPIAEHARLELVAEAKHEWLLFIDPDEVFAPALAHQVAELLPTLADDVSVIHCPWRFFFRGKPLRGTIWGGVTWKKALVRRGGVDLHATVHGGTTVRRGYRAIEIPFDGGNAIEHHWAETYRALVEKHRRYLTLEGPDRQRQGLITGYRDIVRTPWSTFNESFFSRRGFRDGPTGFVLSLLWAAYSTGAKIALLRELRRASANAA